MLHTQQEQQEHMHLAKLRAKKYLKSKTIKLNKQEHSKKKKKTNRDPCTNHRRLLHWNSQIRRRTRLHQRIHSKQLSPNGAFSPFSLGQSESL
jgi:hypothetical protein